MKIFISKLVSPTLDFMFSVLLGVFLNLSFVSYSLIWILFSLISVVALIHNPKFILLGIGIFIVSLITFQFTTPYEKNEPTGIRADCIEYLSSGPDIYSIYTPLILLGQKSDASKEIYDLATRINVVHLFVISGFHISLFFKIINKIFLFIKIPNSISEFLALIPIVIYLFFLDFPISASRAFFLLICSTVNKNLLNKRFEKLQVLSFVMLCMFLINPHNITSYSFILTFLATYIILFIGEMKFKKKGTKTLLINVLAYFSTLPIIISLNQSISVFGMIFSFLLTPIFIFIYVATMFLFPFKDVLNYIYIAFDFVLHSVDSINVVIDITFIDTTIAKYIYLAEYGTLIIYRLWNLYTDKKNILSTMTSKELSQVQK